MCGKAITTEHIDKMRHCIGLERYRAKRGKYIPHCNCYASHVPLPQWEYLVDCGYATARIDKAYTYALTRRGMDVLGMVLGIEIGAMDDGESSI